MKDIHARVPIDRIASRVVSQVPPVYKLTGMKFSCPWDSELPIQTKELPTGADDYAGHTWGRLTVIGYHSAKGKGKFKVHKWVVRCTCGRYSVRTHRAIKEKKNTDECCGHCEYLKIVNKRYNRGHK